MTVHGEQPELPESQRPAHPTKQAVWLLVGVTLLLVALAMLSTTGRL